MTSNQAQYLLQLPKWVVENDIHLPFKALVIQPPFSIRLPLISTEDDDFSFFIETFQSEKNTLKFSLHCQEDTSNYGILRIDYHSRHKNPEIANEYVPLEFVPYAGIWLDEYPAHIHYNIEGYKPLAWAIPLQYDSFPIKDIRSFEDIKLAFLAFCKAINLQTSVQITHQQSLQL